MKYTQIPTNTFETIQLNAGMLATSFVPSTGVVSGVIGATSGGVNFSTNPSYVDWGDDIDNCPKNTMELKKLDSYDVNLSGTFVTVDAASAKKLVGAADSATDSTVTTMTKITPRNDLATTDFADLWWIGDYSDKNGDSNYGFIAIHMMNTLSTGGFQIQTGDKSKGQFAFTFTGHYSIEAQDTVPFEIYVKTPTT